MLGSLFIIFVRVGRAIYTQTMVELAVFGCNNKSSNPGVERREWSNTLLPFFSDQTAAFEEVADQTGLDLFSIPLQLPTLSHVTSSFT